MKRTEPFDFYQPTTLVEASQLLKENGPGGRFLAGGTDLVRTGPGGRVDEHRASPAYRSGTADGSGGSERLAEFREG